MTPPRCCKGFTLKNHEELKNFAKLKKNYITFSQRGGGKISPNPNSGEKGLESLIILIYLKETKCTQWAEA